MSSGAISRARRSRNRIRICSLILGFFLCTRGAVSLYFFQDYVTGVPVAVLGVAFPVATFVLLRSGVLRRLYYIAAAAAGLGVFMMLGCLYSFISYTRPWDLPRILFLSLLDTITTLPCFLLALMIYLHQRALRLEEEDSQLPYTTKETLAEDADDVHEKASLLPNNEEQYA